MRATFALIPLIAGGLVACDAGGSTLIRVDTGGGGGGTEVGVGSDGPLAEGFWADLDATSGCADTTLHAWDSSGLVGLSVYRGGFIADLAPGDEPTRLTLDVERDALSVFVEVADPVAINYCTDALSEREVWGHYVAVEGTVVLEALAPASADEPVVVDVDLWNVLVVGTGEGEGHELLIPHLELDAVQVSQAWGG